MKLAVRVVDELRVRPAHAADLARRSTSSLEVDWLGRSGGRRKDVAEQDLDAYRAELAAAQELLYASNAWALLVILQGLDAAGKDGTIAHVLTGVNPQGCSVVSFKQPSTEELAHDFFWRCVKELPRRGRIGIFNRSYYEEVLVARVHPEVLAAQHLPDGPSGEELWRDRFAAINAFERHLVANGTRVVKIFLHVSKDEQRRRFLQRLEDPDKHWKFSAADVAERRYFDDYRAAYEEALSATSTEWAPWYVVPADHKYAMRALVGGILVHEVDALDLAMPVLDQAELAEVASARRALLEEP